MGGRDGQVCLPETVLEIYFPFVKQSLTRGMELSSHRRRQTPPDRTHQSSHDIVILQPGDKKFLMGLTKISLQRDSAIVVFFKNGVPLNPIQLNAFNQLTFTKQNNDFHAKTLWPSDSHAISTFRLPGVSHDLAMIIKSGNFQFKASCNPHQTPPPPMAP